MRALGIAALLTLAAVAGCGKPPADAPDPAVAVTEASTEAIAGFVAEQKGKVVLVDCWATWCGPCRARFPHLVDTHAKYKDKGLVCVSICLDKVWPQGGYDKGRVTEFLQDKKAAFPNYVATDRDDDDLRTRFGLGRGIPYLTLFDKTGARVWDSDRADLDDDEIDQLIEKELAK